MTVLQSVRAAMLMGGLALSAMPALASGVVEAPTALDGTAILPDPSLANVHALPASVATAGVARVSAEADGPLTNCSRHNPCAMAAPARDRVVIGAGRAASPQAATLPNPAPKPRRMLADSAAHRRS